MAKIKSTPLFKQNNQSQLSLLPSNLGDLIGGRDMVRVIDEFGQSVNIDSLYNTYKGGGTTAFDPRMLLKIVLYAYSMKIYTGRKIARAVQTDICFMWLSGQSRPNFRTINSFVSSRAKDSIQLIFKELLSFLEEHNFIRLEQYFCDGSTFRADANQHQMVWKKNAARYKKIVEQNCKELFKQIDALNEQENKAYGDADLEEKGENSTVTQNAIAQKITELNNTIQTAATRSKVKRAKQLKNHLQVSAEKIEKYEIQERKAAGRSGYNKTDEDASAMLMKNKKEILPAYNVLAGCEDQFITGVSVHQNPNDGTCLEEHLDIIEQQRPQKPAQIIADSGFGHEKNYAMLEAEGIENYMKFPSYHKEQTKDFKENPFTKENFIYNTVTDSYCCPNENELILTREIVKQHPKTGFTSNIKEYECLDCSDCRFYARCCNSEKGANRTIQVNERYEKYKTQTRTNLSTETGQRLKKQRSIEIESCFGDIKHNMGFRRFTLRGISKVSTQITLIAMAHNLRKMHLKMTQKVA